MRYFLFTIILIFSCQERMVTMAFEEKDGTITVEAESFVLQREDKIRQWYKIDSTTPPARGQDPDSSHASSASRNAYLEILPDTRSTHADSLITGINFSNQPGIIGILDYPVYIHDPGKYYVWVRSYSTGTEDNGLHVGLNGNWPESGQRMQWCEGKNQWTWASKQRTQAEHCGVERLIFLDIEQPGLHTISFSMREDGFEFDKWMLSKNYVEPNQSGPVQSTQIRVKNNKPLPQ